MDQIPLAQIQYFDVTLKNTISSKNSESKRNHEPHLYCSVFDELIVVEELTVSAFQRHQARQKRSSISPVRGHVLNSKSFVGVILRLVTGCLI